MSVIGLEGMGMPNKNNYVLQPRRLTVFIAVFAAVYFGLFLPIFLLPQKPADIVGMGWSLAAGLVAAVVAITIARARSVRCALPEGLRLSFPSLDHDWTETRRVGEYVEEICSRCHTYHHGRMTRYDCVVAWEKGRLAEACKA